MPQNPIFDSGWQQAQEGAADTKHVHTNHILKKYFTNTWVSKEEVFDLIVLLQHC